jgi:hypothetical protein
LNVAAGAQAAGSETEFSLNVKNSSRYAVRILTQRVGAGMAATITLPVYNNELTSGFDILYELPLSKTLTLFCKGDKRKINKEQAMLQIDAPVFLENYGSFLVLSNKANNSIVLTSSDARLPALEQKGEYALAGTHYEFAPGTSAVYQLAADGRYLIEDGSKKIEVPLPPIRKNHVYRVAYSAAGVELIDVRTLETCGDPLYCTVVFSGDALPAAEQQKLLAELNNALQRNRAPFLVVRNGERALKEQSASYTFTITFAAETQPTKPPLNIATIKCDMTLALARNGKTLETASKSYTEMDSTGVYRVALAFIRDEMQFYQSIAKALQ